MSTSTFGVGDDFDEVLLQSMAKAGGGHFYFIGTAAQIRDHIGSEVGETLEVVAHNVTLELILPQGVKAESLGAFQARGGAGRMTIELGDLVSAQQVEVPLRFFFGFGEVGDVLPAVASLSDRDGVLDGTTARLSWQYADDRANDAQPRERSVDRTVAGVFAARARQRAVEPEPAWGVRGGLRAAQGDGAEDPFVRRRRRGAGRHHRRPAAGGGAVRPRHGRAQPQGGLLRERVHAAFAGRHGQGQAGRGVNRAAGVRGGAGCEPGARHAQ